MGYVSVIMPCAACGKVINCNPNHVPSIKDDNDKRVPICFDCATELNRIYVKAGKDAVPIHPDAYTAESEDKVNWYG